MIYLFFPQLRQYRDFVAYKKICLIIVCEQYVLNCYLSFLYCKNSITEKAFTNEGLERVDNILTPICKWASQFTSIFLQKEL